LSRERLAVFARAPRLGSVKTRLTPPLTQQQALVLHRALVEDTLERLTRLRRSSLERWLYLSEPLDPSHRLEVPRGWSSALQEGDDLGARMATVFHRAFQDDRERVVMVGSDSPTLPLHYLRQAFEALADHDVVLGPAEDGGYYLVGTSRSVPELFQDISWESDRVLKQSTKALAHGARTFQLLPVWYDIDDHDDLLRLQRELDELRTTRPSEIPRRTAAVLASLK